MNIPWNGIWHYTEVAAEAIGLFLIAVFVIVLVCGTFAWLLKSRLGCINREIRTLRKFNRALSNKVKELAEDKRFTAKERDLPYVKAEDACGGFEGAYVDACMVCNKWIPMTKPH